MSSASHVPRPFIRRFHDPRASLVAQLVKNPPAMWETWVRSLGWKILWRREGLPTPVFWPGEFHGTCSPWGHRESDTPERLSESSFPSAMLTPLGVKLGRGRYPPLQWREPKPTDGPVGQSARDRVRTGTGVPGLPGQHWKREEVTGVVLREKGAGGGACGSRLTPPPVSTERLHLGLEHQSPPGQHI